MPQTIQEERLRWVLPIVRKEVKLKDCAKVFPYGKRTLERWVAAYKKDGEAGLTPRSTRPKTHPQETPIRLKEQVIALRRKKKVCALKLKWKLAKQGVVIHERTIGKILKAEGMIRKYRVKKVSYKYIKVPLRPGELVEIDVKYVPEEVNGRQYFQYTAIDCASRWRYLAVYDNQTTAHSIVFLKDVLSRFKHRIRAVKTDNGSIFTNYYTGTNKRSDMTVKTIHAFDQFCASQNIIHYLIDPGKPAQNGKVERSHRSDQESFYDRTAFLSIADLRRKLKRWNMEYNNLEHCGLQGKTPNEMLINS
ncbi:MAG: IS481 family transposase [Candidatus Binatia bacterium]|nr:IS481 family transposase [Candidatus Binatia bacterium]